MNIQFFKYKRGQELKAFINTLTQDSFGELEDAAIEAGLHGALVLVNVTYSKEKPDGVIIEGFTVEGTEQYDIYLLADTYTEERTPSADTLDGRHVMCLVVAKNPFTTASWGPEASEPEMAASCDIDEDWEEVDDMDEYLESREEEGPSPMGELPIGMFYPDNN